MEFLEKEETGMIHEQNVRLWEGGGSQHRVGGCYGSVEGNVGYSKLDKSQTELIVLKTGDDASFLHPHYSMY